MPRRRGFTGQQSRATRLNKTWGRASIASVVGLSTTQTQIIGITFAEATPDNTVLRTRGDLLVVATPNAAADTDVAAFGVAIVSNAAQAAGGLSLPGPIVDANSDQWLWHRFVPLDAVDATATVADNPGVVVRVPIDSKAMRRFSNDQSVLLIGEVSSGAFASVTVVGGIAFLFGC